MNLVTLAPQVHSTPIVWGGNEIVNRNLTAQNENSLLVVYVSRMHMAVVCLSTAWLCRSNFTPSCVHTHLSTPQTLAHSVVHTAMFHTT